MAHNNCKIELKCHSLQYIKIISIVIIIIIILIIIHHHMCSLYRETD